ncbi:MAG: hypothetical protein B6V02_00305 [Thermoprotei archaeon ex4572_64]|nr:MAG: hypothetical protein B6V02_00305 [Thermoprotei archaeon ex4572_64]
MYNLLENLEKLKLHFKVVKRDVSKIIRINHNLYRNDYLKVLSKLLSITVPSSEFSISELLQTRYTICKALTGLDKLSIILTFSSLKLLELALVLLDKDVEDVYITLNGLYIVKKGDLYKVVDVNHEELIKQLVKLANLSGYRLGPDNPSIKFSLNVGSLRTRVSIDRWPVTDGYSVHIRKHKRIFTMTDLIGNGMLSLDQASLIIAQVLSRSNLIIIGEPGSGKTTLLNAIDLTIPYSWRRIYIDETDESISIPKTLQVKIRSTDKLIEVLKTLHRGWGILIIGELREKNHFEAYNHSVLSGLQVLGTSHADSPENLAERFRLFNLNIHGLEKLVIVRTARYEVVRKVIDVKYSRSVSEDLMLKIKNILKKLLRSNMHPLKFSERFQKELIKMGVPV